MNRACLTFLLLLASLANAWAQSPVNAVEPDLELQNAAVVRPPRYDSMMLAENFRRVERIASGQTLYHDSTATLVLTRNGWDNMGLVVDWTASMLSHDALLMRWHVQQAEGAGIRHFTFFNDGDAKYDDEKQIGLTGGIYHCPGGDSLALWTTIEACVKGGNGGDHRENVLEALLEAFYECPECEEFVLVADNSAPIRDFSLIGDIDRPVHVVLVGVYKDGILADYLNLASRTHGSLHTRDLDVHDFSPEPKTGLLNLVGHSYQLRKDLFVKIEH